MKRQTYNVHLSAYKFNDIFGRAQVKCSQMELARLKLELRNNLDCRTEIFIEEDPSRYHPAWFGKVKKSVGGDNLVVTLCCAVLGFICGIGLGIGAINLWGLL